MKKRFLKIIIPGLVTVFSLSCLIIFTGCNGVDAGAAGIILVSAEKFDEMAG